MTLTERDIRAFIKQSDTYFRIPDFQRQYSWHVENCKAFLEDFEEVLPTDKTHYFGTIFFQSIQDHDERIVIDGQQRITTVMLMIIAIYHLVKENPELSSQDYPSERIRDEFLENKYAKESNRIKLKSVIDDDVIFRQIYAREVARENEKSNLYKNYLYFYNYFRECPDLQKYIDGLGKLKIITIQIKDDDNLQKIFEGINSTGVALSEGDKIRNFALMLNNKSTRNVVANNYWQKIEKELVDTKNNTNHIADFFRKFLIIHLSQDVKEKEVYAKFKVFFHKQIKDQGDLEQVEKFYGQILGDLDRYVLFKLNRDKNGKYLPFADASFRIHYLNIEIVYPFLMCILKRYEEGELSGDQAKGFFAVTESYLVRRIMAGLLTTGLNKLYHVVYRDIEAHAQQEDEADALEIYKHILLNKRSHLRFPTTQNIQSRFTDANIGKRYLNFILSSWDDRRQSKESFLLKQIYNDQSSYSIEHIMPQSPTPAWKEHLGPDWNEIYEKYLNNLANLTLTGYNSEYSNRSFQEKLDHENGFKNSPLLINEFIKQQSCWDRETLEARAKWWLEAIDTLWPFPESTFQPTIKTEESRKLSEITGDLSGSKPESIAIGDAYYQDVTHWYGTMEYFLDTMYQYDENIGNKITNKPSTTQCISRHPEDFQTSAEIMETGYYINTTTNTNSKIELMKDIADLVGVSQDDIVFKIRYPESIGS